MTGLSAITFLALYIPLNILVTWQEDVSLKDPDYLDMIVGIKDLQIGTSSDCYLFSNIILRCSENKGDPMGLALAEKPLE